MIDLTSGKTFREMQALERKLTEVLLRAKADRVEAAIAVFALARCARVLINQYPDAARQMLVEQLIVPFLRNEPVDEGKIVLM